MTIYKASFTLLAAVFLIIALVRLIIVWTKKNPPEQSVGKSAYDYAVEEGFDGTEAEWLASLNRKDRRKIEFANKTEKEIKTIALHKAYAEFTHEVAHAKEAGRRLKWSAFMFTKNVLAAAEVAILHYAGQIKDEDRKGSFMPYYYRIIMMHACHAIADYSEWKNLQSVAVELVKFTERYMGIHGINSVMYRHKGTVHYNDRCEGIATAIVQFFYTHISQDTIDRYLVPFDFLTDDQMVNWESFRKTFYQRAIDGTYARAMKECEHTTDPGEARRNQQEHDRNRKERAKRVSKQQKRRR